MAQPSSVFLMIVNTLIGEYTEGLFLFCGCGILWVCRFFRSEGRLMAEMATTQRLRRIGAVWIGGHG
jgi:hypothetical protein